MNDFSVEHHGSIVLMTPHTDEARAWVTEHLALESWQWVGNVSFAVEPRLLALLVERIEGDGLTVAPS